MYRKRRATSVSRHAARRAIVLGGCVAGLLTPSPAHALDPTAIVSVVPSLAGGTTLPVGQVGQGQITVVNQSLNSPFGGFLKLDKLRLVPSCGAIGDFTCTLNMPDGITPAADPDVIKVLTTPTPTASCSGSTFPVAVTDVATGRVSFTVPPDLNLPFFAQCAISFDYVVAKMPTKDADTVADGMQTVMVPYASAAASWLELTEGLAWKKVKIVPDTPVISARANQPSILVGGQLTAEGTVGGTNPDGSMSFRLYGPNDDGCLGQPAHENIVPVDHSGTYVTSSPYTATMPGSYRWKVSYSGDGDNNPTSSACADAPARTTVSNPTAPPPPPPPPPPPGGGTGGGTTPGGAGTTPGTGGTGGTGGGTSAGTKPGIVTRVKLDRFALTRRTFARSTASTKLAATAAYAAKPKKNAAAKKGTTITFALSAPATVTMVVERVVKGKRSSSYGNACVKATKKLAKRKSCTLYTKVATIKRTFKTGGAKKVNFSGRAGRKVLAVGNYRLRGKASAGAGTDSAERRVTFVIVKR